MIMLQVFPPAKVTSKSSLQQVTWQLQFFSWYTSGQPGYPTAQDPLYGWSCVP